VAAEFARIPSDGWIRRNAGEFRCEERVEAGHDKL